MPPPFEEPAVVDGCSVRTARHSVTAHAPGRIEVLGNHTDYNGGCVLGAAIDKGISVAVSHSPDDCHRFITEARSRTVTLPLGSWEKQEGEASWVNYPLGVLWALDQAGHHIDEPMFMEVKSSLPSGAGLSSSAAFEVATAMAVAEFLGIPLSKPEMVALGRRAENDFVGMPCGILDQGVSVFGETGALVQIDCHSTTFSTIALPAGCRIWVFDTGVKHALVDTEYAVRHRECADAFAALAAIEPGLACLAQASPELVRKQVALLSENAAKRALHITEENRRVGLAVDALRRGDVKELGRLLTASHESSRTLFENSCPELDALVAHLTTVPGVFGARLSGGGFGGAAIALTTSHLAESFAESVSEHIRANFGFTPIAFSTQPSAGARIVAF